MIVAGMGVGRGWGWGGARWGEGEWGSGATVTAVRSAKSTMNKMNMHMPTHSNTIHTHIHTKYTQQGVV